MEERERDMQRAKTNTQKIFRNNFHEAENESKK